MSKICIKAQVESSPRHKIFFFPHSGSGPGPYLQWANHLKNFQIMGIQYPGRGSRLEEDFAKSIVSLAMEIIENCHFGEEFIFFGHSLGSLVAYEVAQQLQEQKKLLPKSLFISAMSPPHLDLLKFRNLVLTQQDLYSMLSIFSPDLVEEIKNDEELGQMFFNIMQADFSLVQSYRYAERPKLNVPIHVFGGKEDNITENQLLSWSDLTDSNFSLHLMEGGHFYYIDKVSWVTNKMQELINYGAK